MDQHEAYLRQHINNLTENEIIQIAGQSDNPILIQCVELAFGIREAVTEAEEMYSEQLERNESLECELESAQEEIERLQDEIDTKDGEIAALEDSVEEWKADFRALQKTID